MAVEKLLSCRHPNSSKEKARGDWNRPNKQLKKRMGKKDKKKKRDELESIQVILSPITKTDVTFVFKENTTPPPPKKQTNKKEHKYFCL